MKIKVFDFYSGCGGTSAGLQAAGMEIVFGLDIDPDAGTTFRWNFPRAHFLQKDLTRLRANQLQALVSEHRSSPILFCGCVPCQPFSKQSPRRKKVEDDRIPLLSHFGRFIRYFLPDFVLVENVPGLQAISREPGPLPAFVRLLHNLDYQLAMGTIDCRDYGVPQKRRRFVLLASKIGCIELPPKTHGSGSGRKRFSTVGEWISDLPPIEAGEECASVLNHRAANLSPLNLRRIKATPPGGSRLDWPHDLALACHAGHSGHTDVYGRLRTDQPASALTTRCISLSNGRFGHPMQNRALSVREAASLQTFDRDFRFFGSLNSMARQIGNAVPTLLARRLGERFVRCANSYYSERSLGRI
jgi:DNA (cytosine-5)-methyltransferase 1